MRYNPYRFGRSTVVDAAKYILGFYLAVEIAGGKKEEGEVRHVVHPKIRKKSVLVPITTCQEHGVCGVLTSFVL